MPFFNNISWADIFYFPRRKKASIRLAGMKARIRQPRLGSDQKWNAITETGQIKPSYPVRISLFNMGHKK